ncbi:MAG: hypothetical protein QM621_12815 [Aeromicrobium sp.]|uniref:hypothetical protein n=1 Tax=Aeromicrobium sp. TaxID=1871063 RepID=UPI0039E642E7
MSEKRPTRRRRIAGESGPASPKPSAPSTPVVKEAAPRRPAPPSVGRAAGRLSQEKKTASASPEGQKRSIALPRVSVSFLAAALAVVVGVTAVVLGYLQMRANSPVGYDDSRAAAEAAATAVETVLTVDYSDLAAYEAAAKDVVTKTYYDKHLVAAVEQIPDGIIPAGAQVGAYVHQVAPQPCDQSVCPSDEVTVLVVGDKVRATCQTPAAPMVLPQRLRVTMVEQDGQWLVDAIVPEDDMSEDEERLQLGCLAASAE